MNFKKLICLIVFMLICCNAYAEDQKKRLDFTVSTDKNTYTENDTIVITGKITNISNEEVTLYKNDSLNDFSVSITPIENATESLNATSQTLVFYNPQLKVLKPTEFIGVRKNAKIFSEKRKFNYKCIERDEGVSVKGRGKCINEKYDEGERFVIRLEENSLGRAEFILALGDGGYTLRATYRLDGATLEDNFGDLDKNSTNDLRKGFNLESNTLVINIKK